MLRSKEKLSHRDEYKEDDFATSNYWLGVKRIENKNKNQNAADSHSGARECRKQLRGAI